MGELEMRVSGILRDRALSEMEVKGLSDQELARLLDVYPEGARRLRHQKVWPVGTALEVLDKLGVAVEVKV